MRKFTLRRDLGRVYFLRAYKWIDKYIIKSEFYAPAIDEFINNSRYERVASVRDFDKFTRDDSAMGIVISSYPTYCVELSMKSEEEDKI